MRWLIVGFFGMALGAWIFGERGKLLRGSTRQLFSEWGRENFFQALHGYVYARWTNQYIGFSLKYVLPFSWLPFIGKRGREGWAETYHGKIITPDHARQIVTLDRDVELRNLEHVVPYETARDFVLDGSPDVVVYECCCRSARENPCQPTQVCMVIGQPFADVMLEHNPDSSRRLSQDEALQLLKEEHERGHVHIAYFKDVALERFYAICNCCSCCCGGIEAMVKHDVPMLASSGYVARVDAEACTGCGACARLCHFDAISVNGKAEIDGVCCMGCGVCVDRCPADALALVRDEAKGAPLDLAALAPKLEA